MKLVFGIDGTEINRWILVFAEKTIFDFILHTVMSDEGVASLTSKQLVTVHRRRIAECGEARAEEMWHVLVDVGPSKHGGIHPKTSQIVL